MMAKPGSACNLTLEQDVELVGIFVLPGQRVMQLLEPMPADTSPNLLQGLSFPDQDAHGLAVERITGLQFADGEDGGEGCLAHGSTVLTLCRLTQPPVAAMPPFGVNRSRSARCSALAPLTS